MKHNFSDNFPKYILIFLVIFIILFFIFGKKVAQVGSPMRPLNKATSTEVTKFINNEVMIVEITRNGETHEYVSTGGNGNHSFIVGGHWEGCKYCKENN